jgi:hypothetical protein
MATPTLLTLVLSVLATARLTRLVTADTITGPLRAAVIRQFGVGSLPATGIYCRWCVSMWVAVPVAALALWCGDSPLFLTLAGIPALSWASTVIDIHCGGDPT